MNQQTNEVQTGEFFPALKELKPFSQVEAELANLRKLNATAVFDYKTPKGNKEARSHVNSIRLVKGKLERTRKETKAAALEFGRMVDSEAKRIESELEDMIEVHAEPLRRLEEQEAARKAAIEERLATLRSQKEIAHDADTGQIRSALELVYSFDADESLDEYRDQAVTLKESLVHDLTQRLATRQKYEDEQAELARLRTEAEERQRKEAEAEAERQRQEQERQAQAAREQAERDRIANEERIAREAREQALQEEARKREQEIERQRKVEQDRLDKERREAEERERKLQEQAREQELQLERARREAAEANERAAKAEQEAKEKAERERLKREQDEKAAAEKREANKKHAARINNAAVAALELGGIEKSVAVQVVTMIARGEVPAVSIQY